VVWMGVVASAPAKVILFGEHFVVYGEPAIVLAIDKRAYATVDRRSDKCIHLKSANLNVAGYFEHDVFKIEKGDPREAKLRFEPVKFAVERVLTTHGEEIGVNVEINSTVPVAAGLGSSAAVVAAVSAAVAALIGVKISKQDIFQITYEAEKLVHGTPSGVDPAVSTFGGALLYQMDTGFKALESEAEIPLVVGDTGVRRATRDQVEKVRSIMDRYPEVCEPLKKAAREIVLRAIGAIKENNLKTLGELMNINQALLCAVGVSDESLEWLISAARKAGALGAKLTGAGGGGSMIALATDDKLEHVSEAIMRGGGRPFKAKKTDEGVKIERI
jgi:mevalonate kinase